MKGASETEMTVRRITLADGRYLIFYAFDDESADAVDDARGNEPLQTNRESGV